MGAETLFLTEELHAYMRAITPPEPRPLAVLREDSSRRPGHFRQTTPEQAGLMGLLASLIGARLTLDIGTFRGYSALAVALALPPGGRVVTCDVSAEETASAPAFWRAAGVEDRIDLRLGPARETLDALHSQKGESAFDFAFIDADKTGHDAYYEQALVLVRPGGLILLDNVFWQGRVVDARFDDPETRAIRALNEKVRDDPRVRASTLPLSDGLTVAMRL